MKTTATAEEAVVMAVVAVAAVVMGVDLAEVTVEATEDL